MQLSQSRPSSKLSHRTPTRPRLEIAALKPFPYTKILNTMSRGRSLACPTRSLSKIHPLSNYPAYNPQDFGPNPLLPVLTVPL